MGAWVHGSCPLQLAWCRACTPTACLPWTQVLPWVSTVTSGSKLHKATEVAAFIMQVRCACWAHPHCPDRGGGTAMDAGPAQASAGLAQRHA